MVEAIAVLPDIREENPVVFFCQPGLPGHDFSHGFRRPPADAARFVIETPHEPPHDGPGGFQVVIGHPGDHDPHCRNGPPFDLGLRAVEE